MDDALFRLSVDLLCVADLQGYFREVNPAFQSTLGFSLGELKQRPFLDFVHPEDRPATLAEMGKLAQGLTTIHFENRYLCRDGTYKWLQWTSQPDAQRGLIFGVARDVTIAKRNEEQIREAQRRLELSNAELEQVVAKRTAELQQSEELLRQSQKMEAIGRLAGGIAHDFNNLLTIILGYSAMMAEQIPSHDPLQNELEQITAAGERAASLTRQLLAFSRKQVLQPQILNLNRVISQVSGMLRRLIGEDIALILNPSRVLDPVEFDPGQIEQILLNLVINARDAMPNGGTLRIETANLELDEEYARSHPEIKPGAHVMLAVTDTGVGMDAETVEKIFEPFFTTKGLGRGTGLGLSTVYGIVRQSGGTIWVYSEVGHGTTFKVYIPRAREGAGVQDAGSAPKRAEVSGTETILLVEDDPGVRELVVQILQRRGYTVLALSEADAAIRLCHDYPGKIHLLLTDVVLPKMNGRELAEAVSGIRPLMRVLYMSGYTDNAIVHSGILDPGMAFLEKPITPNVLLNKVQETLAQLS